MRVRTEIQYPLIPQASKSIERSALSYRRNQAPPDISRSIPSARPLAGGLGTDYCKAQSSRQTVCDTSPRASRACAVYTESLECCEIFRTGYNRTCLAAAHMAAHEQHRTNDTTIDTTDMPRRDAISLGQGLITITACGWSAQRDHRRWRVTEVVGLRRDLQ